MKTLFSAVALASITLAGCTKTPPREKLDACQLLTGEEIQAVQNSPIKDTKGSEQSNGPIRTSQCYFGAEQTNRSVSLTVTQAGTGADRKAAKTFWEETFGRFENENEEKASEAEKEKKESLKSQKREEEEEEGAPPKKIEGIGEEAFWSGSRVGGVLYVLKKDVYIRISLGGPDTEEVRIDKSKKLAQKALDRL